MSTEFDAPQWDEKEEDDSQLESFDVSKDVPICRWSEVETRNALSDDVPCQRSLHVAAVYKNIVLIFGGYDGTSRVNDFFRFSFGTGRAGLCRCRGLADRFVGVVGVSGGGRPACG